MAAATAAVVAATATVAAAGISAASKAGAFGGGEGGGLAGAGYVGPSLQERRFNRGTRELLDAERSILDDALAQGKLVEPEMYRALGLEPVYDRPEDPDFASRSQALAGKQSRLAQIQQRRAEIQSVRGAGKKGRAKELRQLNREAVRLNKEIPSLTTELEQRGAVGRRVVGFRPLAGVADPTGSAGNSFGGALDQFNAHLAAALSGKEPLDPTLKRTFDDRERVLRERLRRQIGPDYETSTGGAQALADFDRERAEAFAQYNTNVIGYYSQLSERRAGSLSDLTSGRIRNLSFPATLRAALAGSLGAAAEGRGGFAERLSGERTAKGAAEARIAEARARAQAERTRAITELLSRGGSAVGSAGPTLGTYLDERGGLSGALLGSSVSPAAGGVGPPTQGLAGVGGSLGGGKIQSLLGQ
jgi:hypothetical protein